MASQRRRLGNDCKITIFRTEEAMDFKRVAAAAMTIVFALAVSSGSAFAAEKDDVVSAVHRYLDYLDKDTLETALALGDSPVSIIDQFPPHEWRGPTA